MKCKIVGKCKNCKKGITIGCKTGFCQSCHQLGKNNPGYKHGKCIDPRCTDCGKKLK